jgi:hypothetical protein
LSSGWRTWWRTNALMLSLLERRLTGDWRILWGSLPAYNRNLKKILLRGDFGSSLAFIFLFEIIRLLSDSETLIGRKVSYIEIISTVQGTFSMSKMFLLKFKRSGNYSYCFIFSLIDLHILGAAFLLVSSIL